MSDDLPFFRVVRGTPTPEELAALVGVVMSRSRLSASAPEQVASLWVRSVRPGTVTASGLPRPIGRDAWRASALPR
jgi:Acyl-CoA carboxylase epsilon subunit